MSNLILAERYLNSFVRNVVQDKVGFALEQVVVMGDYLLKPGFFRQVLNNPKVSYEHKKTLLMKVAKELAVDVLVLNLYALLLKKNRFNIVDSIVNQANQMVALLSGQLEVDVTVPIVFNKADLEEIQNMIELSVHKKVSFNVLEDKNLIGGFKARAGFLVFDGTVENSLDKLAVSLH